MKRVDFTKAHEGMGCVLARHGGKHDWYRYPETGIHQAVPRHREIKERLARRIIRMMQSPDDDASGSDQA